MDVAHEREQPLAAFAKPQAFDRPGLALQRVDSRGLFLRFVHRQHKAAVQEFFVDLNGRRRQEDHHRPFDVVLLRFHPSRVRVFARARDGELAFRLQELQRIARFLRAFFLHDREHLVFEILLAQVVEALPGHGAVLHALLFREHREHRLHERGFARRAGALDDHGQRSRELARRAGQIGG